MSDLHDAIADFASRLDDDPMYIVGYALLQQAAAQREVAAAIRALGNGDASTRMGAIEALGDVLGRNLSDVAEAIRDHGA